MSKSDENPAIPKSIRHKKILDRAAEHPDASLDELADGIPSATPDLVEHVLEEYGDPGSDDAPPTETDDSRDDRPGSATGPGEPAAASPEDHQGPERPPDYPSPDELSGKQRRTLRAIYEDPTATQSEIADRLGVSAPTVSNRVNALENFEWQVRRTFVEGVFEETAPTPATDAGPDSVHSATDGGSDARLERLEARLAKLEGEFESRSEASPPDAIFDEPELVHKVVHACMDSELITQDEEIRILAALLTEGSPGPSGE